MLEFEEDREGASLAPENSMPFSSLRLQLPYEMAVEVLTFSHLVLEHGGKRLDCLRAKMFANNMYFFPVSSNKKQLK